MRKNDKIFASLLNDWNPKDVYEWIRGLPCNLSIYADIFIENGVNGLFLLQGCDKKYLKDVIGILDDNNVLIFFDILQYLGFLAYDNQNMTLQKLYFNSYIYAKNIKAFTISYLYNERSNDSMIIFIYSFLKLLNKTFNDIVHWLAKLEFTLITPGTEDIQSIKITTCFLCVDLINVTGKVFKLYLKIMKELSSPKSPEGQFILNDYLNLEDITTPLNDHSKKDSQQDSTRMGNVDTEYSTLSKPCRSSNSTVKKLQKRRISCNPSLFCDLISTMNVIVKFSTGVIRSASQFDPMIFFDAFFYRKCVLKNPMKTCKSYEDVLSGQIPSQKETINGSNSHHPTQQLIKTATIPEYLIHQRDNQYENIWGLRIEIDNESHVISQLLPQSPAAYCQKLNVGDQILAIGKQIIVLLILFGSITWQGIDWKFIPPGAPHFSELLEAAVKSTKHHMKRIIGKSNLTFEEMTTLLSQVGWELKNVLKLLADSKDLSLSLTLRTNSGISSARRYSPFQPALTTNESNNNRSLNSPIKDTSFLKVTGTSHASLEHFSTIEVGGIRNTTSESTLSPDDVNGANFHSTDIGERKDSYNSSYKCDSGFVTGSHRSSCNEASTTNYSGVGIPSASYTRFKFSPLHFIYSAENPTTPEIKRTLNVVENILNHQDFDSLRPNIRRAIIPATTTTSSSPNKTQRGHKINYTSSLSSSESEETFGNIKNRSSQISRFNLSPSPLIDKDLKENNVNGTRIVTDEDTIVPKSRTASINLAELDKKSIRNVRDGLTVTNNITAHSELKNLILSPIPHKRLSSSTLSSSIIKDSPKTLKKSASSTSFLKLLGRKLNKPFSKKKSIVESPSPKLLSMRSDDLEKSSVQKPNVSPAVVEFNIGSVPIKTDKGRRQNNPIIISLNDESSRPASSQNVVTNLLATRKSYVPQDYRTAASPSAITPSIFSKKRRQTALPDFTDYYLPFKQFESINLNKPPRAIRTASQSTLFKTVLDDYNLGPLVQLKNDTRPPKLRERALSDALDLADTLANPELEKKRNSLEKAIQEQNKNFSQIQTWILVKKIEDQSVTGAGNDNASNLGTSVSFQKALSSAIFGWFPTSLKSGWYQTRALLYYKPHDEEDDLLKSGRNHSATLNEEKSCPAPFLYLQTPTWNPLANEMKFEIESLYIPDYMVKPSIRMHNCVKLTRNGQMIYMALSNHSDFKKVSEKLKIISKGYYQFNNMNKLIDHRQSLKSSPSPTNSAKHSTSTP